MNLNPIIATVLACSLLVPLSSIAASDVDQVHPTNRMTEDAITEQIKIRLSADSPHDMNNIVVRTDAKGVVWLTGSATTQALIDRAESIARNTVGVNSVNNQIVVKTVN